MVRLSVEEGGRPVGVEDPRQDRVLGRLQELRTYGFEEGALSEMKMGTLLDITCRCHFRAVIAGWCQLILEPVNMAP